VIKGHNRDTDWFSIIDSEWPLIDKAMQRWLASETLAPMVSSAPRWRASASAD
jgi:hypothetical protein